MKTYTITQEQLNKLEYALVLAHYFVEGQEQGTDQNKIDQQTADTAQEIILQVEGQIL